MVKKALLIGINYKGSDAQLNGCINDISNIRSILTGNCGYAAQNVKVLTEEQPVVPNRANIESNITWLVANSAPGDILFFYYSGHGSQVKDTTGDETDGLDEVLVPLDYKKAGVITDDWLFNNMVCKIPAGVTMWVFTDCCHSGTMLDLKFNYKSMCALKQGTVRKGMSYVPNDWSDRFSLTLEKSRALTSVGNVHFFSGCQDPETSADAFLARTYQGAFSYCFIEMIKNNLVLQPDGTFRFKTGTIKLRNMLKEINCRLDINGFTGQNSQFASTNQASLELTFDP
jgi:hypothetical protein